MIFSGLKYRSLYPQDGLINFQIEGKLNNTSGVSKFGFSGDRENFEFHLSSGQVWLNSPNNLFISSYSTNESLYLSGNINTGTFDIFVNQSPYCIGVSRPTGYYNYFYVDSQNVETDLSIKVSGESPGYSYDPFETFYSGQIIPLTITNSGKYPFKIFSGDIINNPNFSLSGINNVDVTGSKSLSLIANNFLPSQQQIPIILYTNFGDITLNFSASGIPIQSGNFYLFFGPDQVNIVSDVPNNYIVTIKSFTGVNLIAQLEYVSGHTGKYYKNILHTQEYIGNASGTITGSGYISNLQTGEISKFNPLTGLEYGTGTGYLNKFIVSSGNISGEFSTTLVGLASGLTSLDLPVTGTGEFLFEGNIGINGGFLTLTGLSGNGSGINDNGLYYGFTQSGIGTVFIPYTGSSEITGNFDPSQYETVNYISDLFCYTGFVKKFYLISGLTWATGGIITGQLLGEFGYNFEPGIYTFNKGWSGAASGFSAILDSFNPVENIFSVTGTSGYIGGIFYTGMSVDGCNFEEPYFIPTGIPSQIYTLTGGPVVPLDIFVMAPLNTGDYTGDNSNNLYSRTNISRRGGTLSGTGHFNQVFQEPFYESGIWTETLHGYPEEVVTNKTGVIKSIVATPYLFNNDTISGYFKVSGNYTGYQSFVWNGKVTGNFTDYSTIISGISNPNIYKLYANSYNFEMLLKTGTYAFFLLPANNSATASPSISFPTNIAASTLQTSTQIPFQLFVNTDNTVKVTLDYVDGSARNGITYLGNNKVITFYNGVASTQYLNIPLIDTDADSSSFFDVKIANVEGGYISNKDQILNSKIRVNLNYQAPPSQENTSSCCENKDIPTGTGCGDYQITGCNNLLGNQGWSSGNGIFTNTLNLSQPIPEDNNLVFRLYFSGINDRVILKAYTTDGPPISFFDNSNSAGIDIPYIFNTGVSLPSNVYAIYSEVRGGELKMNNSRENWVLQYTCDIDNCGNNYPLPPQCVNGGDFMIITFGYDGDYIGGRGNWSYMNFLKFDNINSFIDDQLAVTKICNCSLDKYGNYITGTNGEMYVAYDLFHNSLAQAVIYLKNIKEDFKDTLSYSFKSYGARTSEWMVDPWVTRPIYFYIDSYTITGGGSGVRKEYNYLSDIPDYYTGRYGYSGYNGYLSGRMIYTPSGSKLNYSLTGMKFFKQVAYNDCDCDFSKQLSFFDLTINKNGGVLLSTAYG